MKSSYCSQVVVKILIVLVQLVATSWTEGRQQRPCPPGQVIHHDLGRLRCCLPVDCGQNHFVTFCPHNGTQDICKPCPRSFALFKRTSSFALENCHVFPLVYKNCSQLPGSLKASPEDIQNCYCELERGQYYMRPEVPLGRLSYCQAYRRGCGKGEQPTQKGKCEPCPRNTVQDEDDNFFLCRPQRNCSAMGLETEEPGSTQKETRCAKPPIPPSHRPISSTLLTTTPAVREDQTTRRKTTVVSVTDPVPPSVGPVIGSEGSASFTTMHIAVLCVVGLFLLIIIVALAVIARHRGWCAQQGTCHRHYDMENQPYPVNPQPCNNDNDNASDDSCCACADSCLASSSKSSGAKTGACAPPHPCKHAGPVPMLEGYLNGKCGHGLSPGEMSEPLYNSISHEEAKLSAGNLATYQNINGVPPTMLTQRDFSKGPAFDYSYPNKVRLPSMDSEEDDSLKKGRDDLGTHDLGTAKVKDGEEFTETDPLLPNLEVVSSSTHPPPGPHPLRGILRNGNNNTAAARGDGREVGGGNRPNLSMLLSSVEGSSQESGGGGGGGVVVTPIANLPYLSQLVSSPHNVQAPPQPPPPPAPVQHQQLQQQAAVVPPEPTQHVHELPPNLQRHLLQQQQQQRQQQQQEGSTLPLRPLPTPATHTQPTLNTSLVQMDELKPALSLAPSPTATPASPPPPTTTGAANTVRERKEHSGSPARISPSQQKEVRGRDGNLPGKTADPKLAEEEITRKGAGPERLLEDETLKKEAMTAASPVEEEEEETTRKSVGGSSGLGDSLELSSPLSLPSEDGRRSRSMYRRSNSEASRSVSPQLPLPPSRSISSPGDKHRPYAVVKPMQSDQSLDALSASPDQLTELTRPLDSAGHQYPLSSLRSATTPERQSSQESSDEQPDDAENA